MRKLLALLLVAFVLLAAAGAWLGATPATLVAIGVFLPPQVATAVAVEDVRVAHETCSASPCFLRGPPALLFPTRASWTTSKEKVWCEGDRSQRFLLI